MAKVVYEFNENKEKHDIDLINNRYKMIYALTQLDNLRRNLYKGYLASEDVIHVRGKEALTEADIQKEYNETKKPVEGTKLFISDDYIEREINSILDDVWPLLND